MSGNCNPILMRGIVNQHGFRDIGLEGASWDTESSFLCTQAIINQRNTWNWHFKLSSAAPRNSIQNTNTTLAQVKAEEMQCTGSTFSYNNRVNTLVKICLAGPMTKTKPNANPEGGNAFSTTAKSVPVSPTEKNSSLIPVSMTLNRRARPNRQEPFSFLYAPALAVANVPILQKKAQNKNIRSQ